MSRYRKVALLISQNVRSVEDALFPLQEQGFMVDHANNGSEGLRYAREHKPDLIVLDISPDPENHASSIDRALTLLELNSDPELSKITVALVTPATTPSLVKPILKEMHFLTKPIQPKAMIEKISQLVPDAVSNILVVDDDESSRDIMSTAAKKAGWDVEQAINGLEALEKISVTPPSVMLLDLMMPEMDGFSLIAEMQKKETLRDIPIIIVSAKELTVDEKTLLQKYADNFIQKGSFTRKSLIDAIAAKVGWDGDVMPFQA